MSPQRFRMIQIAWIYIDKLYLLKYNALSCDFITENTIKSPRMFIMLIEFNVGNFRSFKDVKTFSMLATRVSARDKRIDENNVFNAIDEINLLKSAAVYGANASGKSNLIRALSFMKGLILTSSKESQSAEPIKIEPFRLGSDVENMPSFFEIVFVVDGTRYRYGFEVNTQKIISEWLYHVPTTKEAKLFTRNEEGIVIAKGFKEGRRLDDKTRANALFLSVVAQFNGEISQKILGWFRNLNIISGLNDLGYVMYTIESLQNSEMRDDIIRFVRNLDLGIDGISAEENRIIPEQLPTNMPEELKALLLNPDLQHRPAIKTSHRKYNASGDVIGIETFDLDEHESEGTAKLFALAGPIVDTLKNGRVLIVDELDARLHPLITLTIIGLFNSNETNSRNAQLIFTTHDTNLLSNKLFRRDQIWFTEKDSEGATDLYSLVEYKIKVRNDASFESDYIHGRYGAVPFLGDIRRLIVTK